MLKRFILLVLFLSGMAVAGAANVPAQEVSDSAKIKMSKEAKRTGEAPKMIPPSEEKERKVTSPKGGWSEGLTGKEIQNVQIEVKTEEELKFLQDMGLNCCPGLGMCACEITLEQFDQIKAQRINIKRIREEESQEQDERWERISSWVDRRPLSPTQIIMASMQVNSKEDLEFLRKIGVECCVDTGICKCQINKEQWKQIRFHGFRCGVHVIDTLEWGKETKPKSDKIIPPKPKPEMESPKPHPPSYIDGGTTHLVKIRIKTNEEAEIVQRIGIEVGLNCTEGEIRECFCQVTSPQLEELKRQGIEFKEFEVQIRSK